MADESLLEGLDPFDLLDREAERVHRLFAGGPDWGRPSRCAGWATREMLGHLNGLEDYVRACLDGGVHALVAQGPAEAATDYGVFIDWQVRLYADEPADVLVARWHQACATSRAELRTRGRDGLVDSTIGPYPSWLQSFHFAVEYATHGDDIGVAVADDERADRVAWRATFGRFALDELGKPVRVDDLGDGLLLVTTADRRVELSAVDFVEATQGRLPADHPLDPALRRLLATVP